jgi:hypothetical protein
MEMQSVWIAVLRGVPRLGPSRDVKINVLPFHVCCLTAPAWHSNEEPDEIAVNFLQPLCIAYGMPELGQFIEFEIFGTGRRRARSARSGNYSARVCDQKALINAPVEKTIDRPKSMPGRIGMFRMGAEQFAEISPINRANSFGTGLHRDYSSPNV